MFYIIYNKISIENSSAQLNAMKHCTEPYIRESSSAFGELEVRVASDYFLMP